jgi:hypothetical protein
MKKHLTNKTLVITASVLHTLAYVLNRTQHSRNCIYLRSQMKKNGEEGGGGPIS